jgi:hypothetical protein
MVQAWVAKKTLKRKILRVFPSLTAIGGHNRSLFDKLL